MAQQHSARSEQGRKHDYVKELNQLKIQQKNLEKERQTHVLNKRGEFYDDFHQLEEMEQRQTESRTVHEVKLQQQLYVIKNKVRKFQKELRDIKPNPEFVEKIKVLMEEVESSISSLKEQQKKEYDELMKDEKITSMEIEALEKKFETWLLPIQTETKVKKGTTYGITRDITEDLPPEVAAFERFVEQSGGLRGGWDEYDHGTFLKFRVKHKNKPGFIRDLIPNLPTRSEHEITEHERWYQQYLELNEEKKAAIQKWREKKAVEKETVVAEAEAGSSDDEEEDTFEKRLQAEQERKEKLQLVNKWKAEKELKKAQEEEQKLRQQMEAAKKEAERKQKQEMQRQKVESYKKQKAAEKAEREQEARRRRRQEQEEKQRQAPQLISMFQLRDQITVDRKLTLEHQKELEEKKKEERLEKLRKKVEVHVERDPNRLLQPTRGWEEKQREQSFTAPSSGRVIQPVPVMHKAIPAWRQTTQ